MLKVSTAYLCLARFKEENTRWCRAFASWALPNVMMLLYQSTARKKEIAMERTRHRFCVVWCATGRWDEASRVEREEGGGPRTARESLTRGSPGR